MKFNAVKRILQKKYIPAFSFVVRLGIGCMFIYSSLPKIRQPYDFLANVYNFELVGPKLGMLTAMTLPWAELLVGICLVGGIFVSGALLASCITTVMLKFGRKEQRLIRLINRVMSVYHMTILPGKKKVFFN